MGRTGRVVKGTPVAVSCAFRPHPLKLTELLLVRKFGMGAIFLSDVDPRRGRMFR